jgi:hypothetical protein
LFFSLVFASAANAAVFQYRADVSSTRDEAFAYCWISANANRVRGVIMSGMTLLEKEMSQDPAIRRACEERSLAIVFLTCGIGAVDPEHVLDDLTKVSAYREIANAPLMFVGRSAGGPPFQAGLSGRARRSR